MRAIRIPKVPDRAARRFGYGPDTENMPVVTGFLGRGDEGVPFRGCLSHKLSHSP